MAAMKVEQRFLTADGPQIFTGNEALLNPPPPPGRGLQPREI